MSYFTWLSSNESVLRALNIEFYTSVIRYADWKTSKRVGTLTSVLLLHILSRLRLRTASTDSWQRERLLETGRFDILIVKCVISVFWRGWRCGRPGDIGHDYWGDWETMIGEGNWISCKLAQGPPPDGDRQATWRGKAVNSWGRWGVGGFNGMLGYTSFWLLCTVGEQNTQKIRCPATWTINGPQKEIGSLEPAWWFENPGKRTLYGMRFPIPDSIKNAHRQPSSSRSLRCILHIHLALRVTS